MKEWTPEEIKSLAQEHFDETNPDWVDENQRQDTMFGFRIGFKVAMEIQQSEQQTNSHEART